MSNKKKIKILASVVEKELDLNEDEALAEILEAIINKKINTTINNTPFNESFDSKEAYNKFWYKHLKQLRDLAKAHDLNRNDTTINNLLLNERQFQTWLAPKIDEKIKNEKAEAETLNQSKKKLGKPTRRPEIIEALNRLYPSLNNLPLRKTMHEAVCAYLGQDVLEGGLYSFDAFKNALRDWKRDWKKIRKGLNDLAL